jgi:hypothetical protein
MSMQRYKVSELDNALGLFIVLFSQVQVIASLRHILLLSHIWMGNVTPCRSLYMLYILLSLDNQWSRLDILFSPTLLSLLD